MITIAVPAATKTVQLTVRNVLSYSATDPGAVPATRTYPSLTATATFRS